jgi:hypothetical protein
MRVDDGTFREALFSDVKVKEKPKKAEADSKALRSDEEEQLRKVMGKDDKNQRG